MNPRMAYTVRSYNLAVYCEEGELVLRKLANMKQRQPTIFYSKPYALDVIAKFSKEREGRYYLEEVIIRHNIRDLSLR